jgi:hypothetical protein
METITPETLQGLAELAIGAAKTGNWALLLSLALGIVVFLVRKFVGPKVPFLQTQLGGALLTLVGSFGAAITETLAKGTGFGWETALAALKVAFTAAGGWTLIKHLLTAFKPVDPVAIKNEAVAAGVKAVGEAKVISLEEAIQGHLENKKEGDK